MMYRQGSVTVTNGSSEVTGAGTDFVAACEPGYLFYAPDLRFYEVTQVVSATKIIVFPAYQSASAGGQAYGIFATTAPLADIANDLADLLGTFGAVRDGVGQGLFQAGTVGAPGVRGAADQDTGLRWAGANVLALVTGGTDRITVLDGGNVGIGVVNPGTWRLNASQTGTDVLQLANLSGNGVKINMSDQAWGGQIEQNAGAMIFRIGGLTEAVRIDAVGNLLVGTSSGGNHLIAKSVTEGNAVLQIVASASGTRVAQFNGTAQEGFNGARAALWLGKDSTTGRSGGFAGTVNASGADYAEYMVKAAGCGTIAKGDLCGVDRDGKLTNVWADSISFVVKSTDPSLVGGDTWAAHLPSRPEAPGSEPHPPILPAPPAEAADDAEMAAYRNALAAYPSLVAEYQAASAAWAVAMATYERELSEWEVEFEAARLCVDRVAFCGQVPCNVSGDFDVGDYIVASRDGDGIKAVAVKIDAITLSQYMMRIGKVWAIRDGRAWIDVQHG